LAQRPALKGRIERFPGTGRAYLVFALAIIIYASGMATGFDMAYKLATSLLIVIAISFVWSWWSTDRTFAKVERPATEASVGETITDTVTIETKGAPPTAWVEVEDETDIPGASIAEVVSMTGIMAQRKFSMKLQLKQRGEFSIGPLVIRTSDPFDLFPKITRFQGKQDLLVFPQVVDVPDFATPSALLAGDTSRRRRAYVLSPEVSSIRDYAPGDSISRIHWPSTARSGKLMVKTFDQGSANELWVVMDQHADIQLGEGVDSTDECSATVAASAVHKYLGLQLPVGFKSSGSETVSFLPERGNGQRTQVFRHIARSKPTGQTPILGLLAEIEREVGRGSSVVAITSSPDGDWVDALGAFQRRGVQTVVVTMDRSTWAPGEPSASPRSRLLALGIRTYIIRKGASISAALAEPEAPGIISRAAAEIGEAAG
jgi:uncharacterized protein (DUF58 family)